MYRRWHSFSARARLPRGSPPPRICTSLFGHSLIVLQQPVKVKSHFDRQSVLRKPPCVLVRNVRIQEWRSLIVTGSHGRERLLEVRVTTTQLPTCTKPSLIELTGLLKGVEVRDIPYADSGHA